MLRLLIIFDCPSCNDNEQTTLSENWKEEDAEKLLICLKECTIGPAARIEIHVQFARSLFVVASISCTTNCGSRPRTRTSGASSLLVANIN